MECERTVEQRISREDFPEISLISKEDWKKLREHMLVSSGGYDTEAIKQQLEFDFNPLYENKHQNVPVSEGRNINPDFIAESFHQENMMAKIKSLDTDVPFMDFITVIFDTYERLDIFKINADENLKNGLIKLFSKDLILMSLSDELYRRTALRDEKEILAVQRAIMAEQALLIAINYPQVF